MITTKAIGKKIKLLRRERNMSQRTLALKTGVSSAFICLVELGKRRLTHFEFLLDVTTALNTTLDHFIDAEDYDQNIYEFYTKFGHLKDLSEDHQKIVLNFINQLKKDYT